MPHKQYTPEKAQQILDCTEKMGRHPWFTDHIAEPLVRNYWKLSGEHPNIWIMPKSKQKIPEGPFVAAVNHSHNDDSPAVKILLRDRDVLVPGALYLYENPHQARLYTAMGSLALARGGDDVLGDLDNWGEVKSEMVEHLGGGEPVFIFHEGTREPSLEKAKMGAADVAIDAEVPIVPIALAGTHIKGSPLAFAVGDPIAWESAYDESRNPRRTAIKDMTYRINDQMAELFVESYELLASQSGQHFDDIFPGFSPKFEKFLKSR